MSAKKYRHRGKKISKAAVFKLPSWLKFDYLVITGILIYSGLVWWPTRFLPYFWDSAGFVINSARSLKASNFVPFIAAGSDFAHPPFFIALLSLAWILFGEHIWVSHLLMLPILPILMISTYYLGKKFLNETGGVLAAFLVGVAPVVLAEYGLIYLDLPVAALATLGLALWFNRSKFLGLIIFTLALLTKNTVIALWPILVLDTFLQEKSRLKLKAYLSLLIPLAILAVFYVYHYRVTGWWLYDPGRKSLMPQTIGQFLTNLEYMLREVLLHQQRWLLTGAGLISAVLLISQKQLSKLKHPGIILPALGIASGIGFFTLAGEYGTRYGIFLLPLLTILSLGLLHRAAPYFHRSQGHFIPIALGLLALVLWILSWHPKSLPTANFEFRPPDDLRYMDMLWSFRQADKYLEIMAPDAQIFGAFPENQQLTQTYQGYVSEPLNFSMCTDFVYSPHLRQILYIHPYSPIQMDCAAVARRYGLRMIQRYEQNGKWIELLEITGEATPSSQTN